MSPRRNTRRKTTPQKQVKEVQEEMEAENSTETSEVAGNEATLNDENTQNANVVKTEEENTEESKMSETKMETEEEKEEEEEEQEEEKSDETIEKKEENMPENKQNEGVADLPFKVKVSHLPASYVLAEFQRHILSTFKIKVDNIICPGNNSPWLLIPFATKEEQENLVRLLHNHIWKKKALRAIAFHSLEPQKHRHADGEDETDPKRTKLAENLVLTLEEEILSESLPLYSVPYEEQNRLTVQDVELLSNKLHAFMCVRNPGLAGWAEAMCEKNQGFIYKIEPLKPSPILEGYRNKCKFRIGKNADGEITVGFCLNDNENKILGVQPGDKLIHLPDSMKYAAKKFEDYIRKSGKEPYDKKKKSGFWDHIIIRVAPAGELMLVVVMYYNQLSDENITAIKNDVKEFFTNGEGKDCNLFSLFFQVMGDKSPILPPDKLELLMGLPSFQENICGLKFHVGPFSILNVNSPSAENIYKSIIELAEPTPDCTVIDMCSGTGGIAFTIADKCKQVIAIESQQDNVNHALKTKELNGIKNVEFIKGKVEDELSSVFEKLGNTPIIPIIDPPRQGLVQKAISLLRSNKVINKLVYVCSNSKMGVKNFLDLCASSEKKEGTFGNPLNVEFAGLPFLPLKAIPVDIAPYTVNNTIIILFERIDPSTFPPAKNPPPVPLKKPQTKKDEKKKHRKGQGNKRRGYFRHSGRGRNNKKFGGRGGGGGGGGSGGRFSGPPRRVGGVGMGGGGMNFNSQSRPNRFPPPLMRSMEPTMSLVAKYERRIAELEQQDRAFKAGLTMGLQALGSRTGGGPGGPVTGDFGNYSSNNSNFRNIGDFPSNDNNFSGGFGRAGGGGGGGGGGFKDNFLQFNRDRNTWQRNNIGRNSFGSSVNMGNGFGGGVGGGGSGVGGGPVGAGNNFGGNFGGSGFNNFGGGSGFGNFGGGIGAGSFSSSYAGGGGGGSGNFRNYQGNKNRRSC